MNMLDGEQVVTVVKYRGKFRWFRSDRELWVLDLPKWTKDFVNAGYDVPESDPSERFGIPVVNENTVELFLKEMRPFKVDKSELAGELMSRFADAKSWWDVGELFPIMFMDCDKHYVAAFYPGGTPMERYVPDGWAGEFKDFATEFEDDVFPMNERFWIQGGVDMLEVLDERGKAHVDQK